MAFLGKLLGGAVLLVALGAGGLWVFGPREPVELDVRFDAAQLEGGVDAYLAAQEARFDDITPGVEKRVIWAGAPETKTPVSLVYLHGFSATSEEIRPVPDEVARVLGANLVFTRLAGHGRGGAAMDGPRVRDWMQDVAEALAVGRATGERVIVMATSTGATLATLAAADPALMEGVAGMVMVSPNYKVKAPAAVILTWPGVRWWGPKVAGAERRFEPSNAAHGTYWTTAYPTEAVIPMGASVKAAREMDHGALTVPVLFLFDDLDDVVDQSVTREVAARWGGPVTVQPVSVGAGDDPYHHVIAGDILSPGMNGFVIGKVLDWVATLP